MIGEICSGFRFPGWVAQVYPVFINNDLTRQPAAGCIRSGKGHAILLPGAAGAIRVEYVHGGNKAVFFFAAENRIDFRDLVKDLAQRLHTRIVMRQVGVRDESRMTGGIGSCGCETLTTKLLASAAGRMVSTDSFTSC